jgi:hypothetical protein
MHVFIFHLLLRLDPWVLHLVACLEEVHPCCEAGRTLRLVYHDCAAAGSVAEDCGRAAAEVVHMADALGSLMFRR